MSAARARNQLNEESDRLQTQIRQLQQDMIRLRQDLDRAMQSKQRVNAERRRRNAPIRIEPPPLMDLSFPGIYPRTSLPQKSRYASPLAGSSAAGSFPVRSFTTGFSSALDPPVGFGFGFRRPPPAQAAPTPERGITINSNKTPIKGKSNRLPVGLTSPKEYVPPKHVPRQNSTFNSNNEGENGEGGITYLHHEEINEGVRKSIYDNFKKRYDDLYTQSDIIYKKFDRNRGKFSRNQLKKIIDFFSILEKIKKSFLISLNKVSMNSDLRLLNQQYTRYLDQYQENLSRLNSFIESEGNFPNNLSNFLTVSMVTHNNLNSFRKNENQLMYERLNGSVGTPEVKERKKRGSNMNSNALRGYPNASNRVLRGPKVRRPNFVEGAGANAEAVGSNGEEVEVERVHNYVGAVNPLNGHPIPELPTQPSTPESQGGGKRKKGKKRSSKRV
jgi:hypothetical protein